MSTGIDAQIRPDLRQVSFTVNDIQVTHRSRGQKNHSTGTGILLKLWNSLDRTVKVTLPANADMTSVDFELSDFGILLTYTVIVAVSPVLLRKSQVPLSVNGPLGGMSLAPIGATLGMQ